MPTINQPCARVVAASRAKSSAPALEACPQNVVYALVYILLLEKPNSALPWVAKVRLTNGFEVISYIGGEDTTCRNTRYGSDSRRR